MTGNTNPILSDPITFNQRLILFYLGPHNIIIVSFTEYNPIQNVNLFTALTGSPIMPGGTPTAAKLKVSIHPILQVIYFYIFEKH